MLYLITPEILQIHMSAHAESVRIKFRSLIMYCGLRYHRFHLYYVNFTQQLEENNFNHKLQF